MSKKIKKYMLKRELKRLLEAVKKHWIWLLAVLAPVTLLLVLHHIKRKAKKKIRKAVKVKVREKIENKISERNDNEELSEELALPD